MSSARMRPSAWCSATGSLDVTGVMISASSLRASSTRMSGPPWAKQSSVSWAMGLFRGAGARLGLQPAVGDDEVGDRLDVVEVESRHRQARQLHVGGNGDPHGVVRLAQRLAVRRPVAPAPPLSLPLPAPD